VRASTEAMLALEDRPLVGLVTVEERVLRATWEAFEDKPVVGLETVVERVVKSELRVFKEA
jgi:hypothetical protein